ncbi:MAG: hypothetical protein ABW328_10275 [Ilumatobacteraceae bacterium]
MSSVVQDLRRARRTRRLGELEWFEVAYRVYLAALVGGFAVLWLSSLVKDEPATASQVAAITEHGPAVLGAAVALAIALGLRSGSDGGPISVEAADVRILLLAPIPRRTVLARPVGQRLRSMAFGGALVGAIAGQLAARRLPGSPEAWAASGAAYGALTGVSFVAVAVLVHVGRVPRWLATSLAAVVLAAQGGAIAGWWPGPGDRIGSLALWGMRQEATDLVAAGIVVALGVVSIVVAGRLRVEPLVKRADLVSQLRFAVTMQDLRTVVLLRRQLRGERPRTTPWIGVRRGAGDGSAGRAIWRRSWRGLLRYPLARLGRMAALSIAAGVGVVAVLHDITPALAGIGVALYLLGLDAVEPLSQEIDHPDYTDAVPLPRGWLLVNLLAVPAMAMIPFALIGALTVIVAEPEAWAFALGLCVPVTLVGICGAIVSIVRDAPDPLAAPASSAAVPPEFAGFTSTLRLLLPIAISAISGVLVVGVGALPPGGTARRIALAALLVIAATGWWVRKRDEWREKWRAMLDAGKTTSSSSAAST